MALTRVFRLSNSRPLYHCGRTFSTTRLVFPTTINRDSKSPLIGSFVRLFSTSPVVSDDMQKSVSADEDLICSVKSLRQDVESLRKEFSSLSEVVHTMQKCIPQRGGFVVSDYDYDDANDYACDSLLNGNEKTTEKSNFSKIKEALGALSRRDTEIQKTETEAMAAHFNTNAVIGQDGQAAEKVSELSEEIREGETVEEIRESDGGDNDQKVVAAEGMSDFSKIREALRALSRHDTEIQKTETEGNKEQNSLLEEIESEISRAVEFSHVSSQSANFPDDFPFKLEKDVHGIASITLKGRYKSENIVVTVDTPSVFTPITSHNYNHYKSSNFIMKLIVEIFPAISEGIPYDCSAFSTGFMIENVYSEGRELAFECSAFSNGFMIENVYGRYGDKLIFRELNDDLQTELKKYLETRGIKPSTTNCILGYMLHKKNRDNLRSLIKFRELLEA